MLILVGLAAFITSLLTFFSGFGLGTLLSPVFVLFLPVPLAIAATGIVHLTNNLFKLGLMYQHINWLLFTKFSIPAGIAAAFGAWTLSFLSEIPPLLETQLLSRDVIIYPLKLVIGSIFIIFSFSELMSKLKSLSIPERYVMLGGVISGFFGGLSGNQGAFRSAFLIKFDLKKEEFIATGIISACLVDLVRLPLYFIGFLATTDISQINEQYPELSQIMIAAILFAFLGALIGRKFLHKITMKVVKKAVSYFMLFVGCGLIVGLI